MPENDSAHIKGLLETVEGAVILAHSVFFQNLVCDAKIVAATLKAAELYGFNHPTELEGKFTSQLDHPDDYYMIKMITIARMLLVITDSVDPAPHRSLSPKRASFRASCQRNICL